jgi:hypothetical protein
MDDSRTNPPLLLRERRRIVQRPVLTHDRRRVTEHYFGYVDLKRLIDANAEVGNAAWMHPFSKIFGNLNGALHHMPHDTARVLKFPERRSDLARLRSEIQEMKRSVSVGAM